MIKHIIDVLLIDDDQLDCELIQRLLKKTRYAYRLKVFHDGITAINYLDRRAREDGCQAPYLIMLDINIPAMSGFQILEKIREFKGRMQCKVYIFTTSNNFHDQQKATIMGVQGYYLKKDLTVQDDLLNGMMENFLEKNQSGDLK